MDTSHFEAGVIYRRMLKLKGRLVKTGAGWSLLTGKYKRSNGFGLSGVMRVDQEIFDCMVSRGFINKAGSLL